ncbi:histidine kinase [Sphingomonas sp. HF-S3]|uniref:Histidine kinase n=1 Tax=Sphingomonas rustica TaxID=3103142 RepID=A0ABV0BB98_9SPHN
MTIQPQILLFEPDPAVAAALAFSLELDGFRVIAGHAEGNAADAACLVLDHRQPTGDGLALLGRLRQRGCRGPAVILATNPSRALRDGIARAGAALVEKPLLGEGLTRALRSALAQPREA